MEDISTLSSSSSSSSSIFFSPALLFSNPSPKYNVVPNSSLQNSNFFLCPTTQKPESSINASLKHSSKHPLPVDVPDPVSSVDECSNYHSSHYDQGSDKEKKNNVLSSPHTFRSSVKVRSCDVYIGLYGRTPSVLRFGKWLCAELELQGVSCFVANHCHYRDSQGYCMVERAMDAATLGVVIVTRESLSNRYTIDELQWFSNRKNLVPIFFGLNPNDCLIRDIIERRGKLWEKHGGQLWTSYGGSEKVWKDAIYRLLHVADLKLVAHPENWRDCISEAVVLLGMRLGNKGLIERVKRWKERVEMEEFPFPRNGNFIGRKKELLELELILFGDVESEGENESFELSTRHMKMDSAEQKVGPSKGKELVVRRESEDEIEMQGTESSPSQHSFLGAKNDGKRRKRSTNVLHGKGIACISGDSGIGKTELLLEFTYRFSQRYRMIFWVGGESRYIRQNFMNLLPLLDVDLSIENQLDSDRYGPRSFKELEEEAIRRVRKELMRNIPYLIVIDNLESERDWWDAKNVIELIPRFSGETHIIISTRLSQILNMVPLKLSHLSAMEAMSLMKRDLEHLSMVEINALKAIEEKLCKNTLGLALVGAILSELPISPVSLLNTINQAPCRDFKWTARDDRVLQKNSFFMQLLEVCFFIFRLADNWQNLATRMALASGWFAPSPIPVSMLAFAAGKVMEDRWHTKLWKKCAHFLMCRCMTSYVKNSKVEAVSMLLRFRIARSSTKRDCIHFHDIVKLYARKRGSIEAASAMVRAVNAHESLSQYSEQIWAACFLLFKFGNDPACVKLNVDELLSFTKRFVLPLAFLTFTAFSRYAAAKELLGACTEALDAAENSLISRLQKELHKLLCSICSFQSTVQLNPSLYHELALMKAALLEMSVKLTIKCGEYDIGEENCRMAIGIRSVVLGPNHPKTIASKQTMYKLRSLRRNEQCIKF